LLTAKTENQLANLAGQTEIATAEQKRDAEVARIRADGEAIKLKTDTDAKNAATMNSATAQADAVVIKAKADAQAVEIKAQADAKAILLRADAEAKRAQLLQSQPLGGELALFELYAGEYFLLLSYFGLKLNFLLLDMVKQSMKGVEKVIYMPTEAMNHPLSFYTFNKGNIPGFNAIADKKK